jgi:hypothetical protein
MFFCLCRDVRCAVRRFGLRKDSLAGLGVVKRVGEEALIDLAVLVRADLADLEARIAPYFIFRGFLAAVANFLRFCGIS